MKALARELDVPVWPSRSSTARSRARGRRKPRLSDLRESGAIEQDADLVIFIYEPRDENSKGIVAVDIAKHRNGPTGLARLGFVRDYTKFRTLKADEASRYDF